MSNKNRKKISEEEERKYPMEKVVRVFIQPNEEVREGVYVGVLGDLFMKDGHRTLEVVLVDDVGREEPANQRITVTSWRRTTWEDEDLPNLWVKECLAGWSW